MDEYCTSCMPQFGDMVDLTGLLLWSQGQATVVLCAGCGPIQVDPEGYCMTVDCLAAKGQPNYDPHHHDVRRKWIAQGHPFFGIPFPGAKPIRPRTARSKRGRRRIVAALIARDGPNCGICNQRIDPTTATIDHIVPKSKGGTNLLYNLQLAHDRCNQDKGNGGPNQAPTIWPVDEQTEKGDN
jgi:hypothetical protein